MLKIEHERTADVVLAGMREHESSTPGKPLLGSLLLGLYDDAGELQHLGVSASFTAARRAELWEELQALACDIADHPWGRWNEFLVANPGRVPGTQSRWSQGKDLSFTPLRPERVLEVRSDHMEGSRFRPAPRTSSGGAPTAIRSRAATVSWRSLRATTWVNPLRRCVMAATSCCWSSGP